MKFSAWYGIVVGFGMIVQWTFFILSGNVPEFQTEPLRISFHLGAEALAATMLIIGGIGTLKSTSLHKLVLLVGLGMIVYSEIISPGYFAQQGQWLMVGMFAIILIGAVTSIWLLIPKIRPAEDNNIETSRRLQDV